MYPQWLSPPLVEYPGSVRKVIRMFDDSGNPPPKPYKRGPIKKDITPHMQVVLEIVRANPGCCMADLNRAYGGKVKNLLWRLTDSGYVNFEGTHGKRRYYETEEEGTDAGE